ncbi:hypothetical protein [Nocardia sp. NPDC020380]|uniref:hypothetical protein n=1 Tax=Nocardia sp. NPDC020380 TaxID=3364309 RepID=UPI00379DF54A
MLVPPARESHYAAEHHGRGLGDISHAVLVGADEDSRHQLLFVDLWTSAGGMENFFGNPFAQQAGDRLFSSREESEWHRAPDGSDYHVPIPEELDTVISAFFRAPVSVGAEPNPDFADSISEQLQPARRRGQLSHTLYRHQRDTVSDRPSSNARWAHGQRVDHPVPDSEVLVFDSWPSTDGLDEYYKLFAEFPAIHAGALTVWRRAEGFIEW